MLRLKGYKDHAFKPVELGDNATEAADLAKAKTTVITNSGSGSTHNNGSGGHTTPPQGSNSDPDGLMHP